MGAAGAALHLMGEAAVAVATEVAPVEAMGEVLEVDDTKILEATVLRKERKERRAGEVTGKGRKPEVFPLDLLSQAQCQVYICRMKSKCRPGEEKRKSCGKGGRGNGWDGVNCKKRRRKKCFPARNLMIL